MKRRMITLLSILTFVGSYASAQDKVIKMTEESGVQIVNDARFDIINKCLGNTKPGTTVCLGEVDFGTGNTYAACGAEFAHENKGTEGTLDFYLGDPDNGGVKITDVEVKGTGAFQYYRTYRFNFYPDGTDGFTYPSGKGMVYMRYNSCEGNLKKVVFYQNPFEEEEMGQMPDPTYTCKKIGAASGSVVDKTAFPETRLNDDGAWGWTSAGLVVKFTGVDFKDGNAYKQIAVVSTHGGSTNPEGFLEIYIDGADNADNMIAKIWTARDWQWSIYGTLAKNLTKNISGTHDIYVKWTGATNLKEIQLIEGTPWDVEDDEPEKVEMVDEPVSANAYGMHFDSMGGIENVVDFMATGSDNLQYEATNIGYTSRGVVLKFNEVDFKDGLFTRILVNHSSDQISLANSSFDFYIDLNHESYDDLSVLANDTKLATVKAQGTGNWGTPKKTAGAMNTTVTGVHDLYMVFNTESGANIHGVYLDTEYSSSVKQSSIDGVKVWSAAGAVYVSGTLDAVVVFNAAGQQVAGQSNVSGLTRIPVADGFCVVKITDNKGNVATYKLSVK